MRKSRFTASQVVGILKEGEPGIPIADLVRKHFQNPHRGLAGTTRWRPPLT